MKLHKAWKDTEASLAKKTDEQMKLDQQRKTDRLAIVTREISELEQRVTKTEEDFKEISETVRKELTRFDRQKARDFKSTVVNYLQCMMKLGSCPSLLHLQTTAMNALKSCTPCQSR